MQRDKRCWDKVKSDLDKARTSVSKVKEEKQAPNQVMTIHKQALTSFCQTMKASNVNMAAVPQLERMIVENEDLLKDQLGKAVGRLYKVINDSATIGSKVDDGWVHWEGGSHGSG